MTTNFQTHTPRVPPLSAFLPELQQLTDTLRQAREDGRLSKELYDNLAWQWHQVSTTHDHYLTPFDPDGESITVKDTTGGVVGVTLLHYRGARIIEVTTTTPFTTLKLHQGVPGLIQNTIDVTFEDQRSANIRTFHDFSGDQIKMDISPYGYRTRLTFTPSTDTQDTFSKDGGCAIRWPTEKPRCVECRTPWNTTEPHRLCPECQAKAKPFTLIRAAGDFSDFNSRAVQVVHPECGPLSPESSAKLTLLATLITRTSLSGTLPLHLTHQGKQLAHITGHPDYPHVLSLELEQQEFSEIAGIASRRETFKDNVIATICKLQRSS